MVINMRLGWINLFGLIIASFLLIPDIASFLLHWKEPDEEQPANTVLTVLSSVMKGISLLFLVFPISAGQFGFPNVTAFIVYMVFGFGLSAAVLIAGMYCLKWEGIRFRFRLMILTAAALLVCGVTLRCIPLLCTTAVWCALKGILLKSIEKRGITMKLYPMKLVPAVKEIIWGGEKLKKSYNKSAPFEKLAESWELTVRPDGMNVVANGGFAGKTMAEVIETLSQSVIGEGYDADRFPLLIKFIDAADRLSIQVHPSDGYALKNENEFGKTEMWYIVEADEGAELVFGLSKDAMPGAFDKAVYDKAVAEGTVESLLNRVKVHAGEVYFIPSGLVHAIGAGLLICEIQQNSNVTYRVYDYNRPGKDGKPRELHVAKAREVIVNYTNDEIEALRFAKAEKRSDTLLASCDKFTVNRYDVAGTLALEAGKESFLSLTFPDGEGTITAGGERYAFEKGDTYFIPAGMGAFTVTSDHAVCIAAGI